VRLPAIPQTIRSASLLTGRTAAVQQNEKAITLSVMPGDRKPLNTVVVLELDQAAIEVLAP